MAYDEDLAQRVEQALAGREALTNREMFGGIVFMVGGNMACGVIGEDLIVRMAKEDGEKALKEEGVRPFDFTGKPMKGTVYVDSSVTADAEALAEWVEVGADYAASLPAKEK